MKNCTYILLAIFISILVIQACSSTHPKKPNQPDWYPSKGKIVDENYVYIAGYGCHINETEARKLAELDALGRTYRAVDAGFYVEGNETDGFKHQARDVDIIKWKTLQNNIEEYEIFILFKVKEYNGRPDDDVNIDKGFGTIYKRSSYLDSVNLYNNQFKEYKKQANIDNSLFRSNLERQRSITDSLKLVYESLVTIEHPKTKVAAWQKINMLWNETNKIQNQFQFTTCTGANYLNFAKETYTKAKERYMAYCKNQKIYWADSESECSKAVFAELSKKIKVEKAECLNGLNLNFSCTEKCRSSSFGVECSFEPSMAIESCSGKSYSLLKSKEPLIGNDMHNENRAREDLIQNLHKAVFLKEWENEIKQWRPQCE